METFTTLSAIAAPVMQANVNTDVIVRIERLINFGRRELEPYAFEAWRFRPDGSPNPVCDSFRSRTTTTKSNGTNMLISRTAMRKTLARSICRSRDCWPISKPAECSTTR